MRVAETLQRDAFRPRLLVVLQVADLGVPEPEAGCLAVACVPAKPTLRPVAGAPAKTKIVPDGPLLSDPVPARDCPAAGDAECREVDGPAECDIAREEADRQAAPPHQMAAGRRRWHRPCPSGHRHVRCPVGPDRRTSRCAGTVGRRRFIRSRAAAPGQASWR